MPSSRQRGLSAMISSPKSTPDMAALRIWPWPVATSTHPEMLGTAGGPGIAPALLATVDGEHLPRDELPRRRGEIGAGLGHVPDIARNFHGVGLLIGLEALRGVMGKARGLKHARRDAVDPDAQWGPFHGDAL